MLFPPPKSGDLAGDLRDLFADLEATLLPEQRVYSGECHPALDVLETEDGVEVIVDIGGRPAERASASCSGGDTLVIAGEKAPATLSAREPTFHLVEREFGRFARAVRLTGAFDVGARARVAGRRRADDRPARRSPSAVASRTAFRSPHGARPLA